MTEFFITPPIAKKEPIPVYFGINPSNFDQFRGNNPINPPLIRIDEYHWLRDDTRTKSDVLEHLKAENSYCEKSFERLKGLQDELYDEMLSHLKETDEEVPHLHGNYYYYSKTVQGLSYNIHCRKAVALMEEVIILDENELAKDHEYSDCHSYSPSPSHNLIAYTIDYSGDETYALHIIKDITTKEELTDEIIEDVSGDIVWGDDDSTLYYLRLNAELRPYQVFMHILGKNPDEDLCIYQEDDEMFFLDITKTDDQKFLVISSSSPETSEVRVIHISGLKGGEAHKFSSQHRQVCFHAREKTLRYNVEHHEGYFYVVTNADGAKNNKLSRLRDVVFFNKIQAAESSNDPISLDRSVWMDVREYNPEEQIDQLLIFKNHIAVIGRSNGLQQLWIVNMNNPHDQSSLQDWKRINFSEQAYSIHPMDNFVYDTTKLRLAYTSFITPKRIIDLDLNDGSVTVLKEKEVPGYEPESYMSQRIEATARDGRQIPMTMVFNKKICADESWKIVDQPVLLYGYGSYGVCIDPSFDYKRSTLLDRGIVYIMAHVRGGGEMGRSWYEDEGKYLNKMNTFHDFGDCAKFLIESGMTHSDKLAALGRSAGGLLMGATCNLYPHLFKAIIADVPFVDVMNTMSDPSIPLTATEWEEWGNPNEATFHDYMLSYSPYDNIKAQEYPSLFITAGLNDPRVGYWEPAKWVAKLREVKIGVNPIYFKTDLSTGHFSASDRYKYIREAAVEYSFLLDQLNSTQKIH